MFDGAKKVCPLIGSLAERLVVCSRAGLGATVPVTVMVLFKKLVQ